jgi:hypothetical protein
MQVLPAALGEKWASFLTQEGDTPATTPREGADTGSLVVMLQGNPVLDNVLEISESQFTQPSPGNKKQRT